jgi:hypothetical protein
MVPHDFKKLARIFSEIADRAADADGFIPLHRLARELRADVEFRPLLVEGLIAAPKDSCVHGWKVLVDIETHAVTEQAFETEGSRSPLGARVRNTVAHELAHTLGFRSREFGFESKLTGKDLIKEIESETEKLSPLFLIPHCFLRSLCDEAKSGLSVSALAEARKRLGVSSNILVARLALLPETDDHSLLYHPALANVAIGLGQWRNKRTAEFLCPPLFTHFSGVSPRFLFQLKNRQNPAVGEVFSDPDLFLNGGTVTSTTAILEAGTFKNPTGDEIKIEFSVEAVEKRSEAIFLWVARAT